MAQLFPPINIPELCQINNRVDPLYGNTIDPNGAILIIANQTGTHLLSCTGGTQVPNLNRYNIFVDVNGIPRTIRDLFNRFATVGGFPATPPGTNWRGIPPGQQITISNLELNKRIVDLGPTNCPDFLNNYQIPFYNNPLPIPPPNPLPVSNGNITFNQLIQPYLNINSARILPVNNLSAPVRTNGNPAVQPTGDPFNDVLRVYSPGNTTGFIKGGIYNARGALTDYIGPIPGAVGFPRNPLPAIAEDEDTLNCALREFYEETGTQLSRLDNLAVPAAPILAGAIEVRPEGHIPALPTRGGNVVSFNQLPLDRIYCLGDVTFLPTRLAPLAPNVILPFQPPEVNPIPPGTVPPPGGQTKTVYFIRVNNQLGQNIINNYNAYSNNSEIFNLAFNLPATINVNMNQISRGAYFLLCNVFSGTGNTPGIQPPNPPCPLVGARLYAPPIPKTTALSSNKKLEVFKRIEGPTRDFSTMMRGGNSEDHFKQKYLKYKQKYMQLKNLI
jgi:hypothetical protein